MIGPHRYTMTHALAASAALGVLVFSQGFANFWQQFVHGHAQVMTPQTVMQNLLASTALFGSLLLVLWGSAFFWCDRETRGLIHETAQQNAPGKLAAIKTAAVVAPFLTAAALGLNWLGSSVIEWLTQVKPADQELVKCFTEGKYPLGIHMLMILTVLLQAPLLEEPIFRGVMFRGFAKSLPIWAAVTVSGFVFALIHVNASSFIALWFLGASFAILYHRTGSILAPMTAHFLFNLTNLILLFVFPDISK